MNKIRIGTDLVQIDTFNNFYTNSRFFKNVFTKKEISYCKKKNNPAQSLAARFAAKEAVIKCLGKNIKYNQIEITNNSSGQPEVTLLDYNTKVRYSLSISLSHTKTLAQAVCLAIIND